MTIDEAILLYVPALYVPKMREAIDSEIQQLRAERDELREKVERYEREGVEIAGRNWPIDIEPGDGGQR